jgi:hypothetical protein
MSYLSIEKDGPCVPVLPPEAIRMVMLSASKGLVKGANGRATMDYFGLRRRH